MVKQIQEALPDMWKNSPPWFALLAVILIFVGYMDRQDSRMIDREKRSEQLADLRIEQCHDVQAKANEALIKLADVLNQQIQEFQKMQYIIQESKIEK